MHCNSSIRPPRPRKIRPPPPRISAPGSPALSGRICPASGRTPGRRQVEGTGRRLLDHHPFRHRRPPRQDVPHRHQRHQRSHDRRKCPGAGRLCEGKSSATSRWPAPSPTTRGIARASSPNCAPGSWRPPASRSISSTAIAARRRSPSPCATSSATAAS